MNRLLVLLCLVFAGCVKAPGPGEVLHEGRQDEADRLDFFLPTGASHITPKGNGWCTFEFDGHTYLFSRSKYDRSASSTCTLIK